MTSIDSVYVDMNDFAKCMLEKAAVQIKSSHLRWIYYHIHVHKKQFSFSVLT